MSLTTANVAICIRDTQEILEKIVYDEENVREAFENSDKTFQMIEFESKYEDKSKKEEYKVQKEDVCQFLGMLQ